VPSLCAVTGFSIFVASSGARQGIALLRNRIEMRIPVDDLMVGHEFVVRPGDKIAIVG